jgi:RHS repeat-associated protein
VLRSFGWSAGGLLSTDATTGGDAYVYNYNYLKQMVSVDKNGTQVGSYAYDYQGERVAAVAGSTGTEYIFDESGHLLAEYNAVTGVVAKQYVWLDDIPVAMIDSTTGTPAIYYITTGHLNEPQQLIDGAGNVAWNAYINPWGWTGTFSTPTETINLRLPGQYEQAEANNLSKNRYRDYDPSIGRYIQGDPLGIDAGPNVFSYADNDPYDRIDPSGLWQVTLTGAYIVGGRITFGNNGGQWNAGGFLGLGFGISVTADLFDSGCKPPHLTTPVVGEGEIGLGPHITAFSQILGDDTWNVGVGIPGTPYGYSWGADGPGANIGFGGSTFIGAGAQRYY